MFVQYIIFVESFKGVFFSKRISFIVGKFLYFVTENFFHTG